MVSHYVLVGPSIHGGTVEEVLSESTNSFPNPRLVCDGKVTAKDRKRRRVRGKTEDSKKLCTTHLASCIEVKPTMAVNIPHSTAHGMARK